MLRLSTKARYALRAMIELARHEGEGPLQLREIARAQRISPKYLEQLVIPLRHAGLLRSERGPSGGYLLTRSAHHITALDVVRAADGPPALLDCIGESAVCPSSATCAARALWAEVSDAVTGILAEVTLADLRDRQGAAEAAPALCYDI